MISMAWMFFWDVLITICFVVFPLSFEGTSAIGMYVFPILAPVAVPVLSVLEPFPYSDALTAERSSAAVRAELGQKELKEDTKGELGGDSSSSRPMQLTE